MTRTLALVLCASLAACGGKTPPAASPATAAGSAPACEPAAPAGAPPEGNADEAAKAELARAQLDLEAALAALVEAQERIERLEEVAIDLIEKVNDAIAAVDTVKNDPQRAAAKARLEALQKEQAELQARIKAAKAAGKAGGGEAAPRKQGKKAAP